jgi:PAS domain-containing protein
MTQFSADGGAQAADDATATDQHSPLPAAVEAELRHLRQEVQRLRQAQAVNTRAGQITAIALERDEEFIRALLNNLSEAILACDAQGHLTLCNTAARELLGLPTTPTPGLDWTPAARFTPPAPRILCPLQRTRCNGPVRANLFKTGSWIYSLGRGIAARFLLTGIPSSTIMGTFWGRSLPCGISPPSATPQPSCKSAKPFCGASTMASKLLFSWWMWWQGTRPPPPFAMWASTPPMNN